MSRPPRPRARRLLQVGGAALLLAGAGLYGGLRQRAGAPARGCEEPVRRARDDGTVARAAPRRAPVLAARGAPRPTGPELASDGVPIMGPGTSDSTADGPRHPHPITPAHRRLFRENALLAELNGAVDGSDAAGLRRLAERYRAEFPEDAQQLQAGYFLIADCLDGAGVDTRARAERYFAEERASLLRRYVQRHCLR